MRIAFKAALAALFAVSCAAQAWEPTKNVEFIIPAGTGGGADQMARAIQGIVAKHNLMKQSIIPINKAGGAGAEGFLDVKNASGDPHKIIITLSNLFTTPLATGVPFNWRDLTPVKMLALDEFVLWVNAEKPYKTAKEYIDAAKAANGTEVYGGRKVVGRCSAIATPSASATLPARCTR
jgi:putative tricarboxylic transport membrane protein